MRTFGSLIFLLIVIFLLGFVSHAGPNEMRERAVFRMADPAGDDRGSGRLTYPRDRSFQPHSKLLDLTLFEVKVDASHTYFDVTLGALANPWNAPEGFYHPRIDIYIFADEAGGHDRPLRPGSNVRFLPRYPWHYWLRVAPFGGTALFHASDDPQSSGRQDGVSVRSDDASSTVRIAVERSILPPPSGEWRYYVLVGSFDGFGDDGYRAVTDRETRWLLGSPEPFGHSPIVDILAPTWGPYRQERQLNSMGEPILRPVGGFSLWRLPLGIAVLSLLIVKASMIWLGNRLWTKSRFGG